MLKLFNPYLGKYRKTHGSNHVLLRTDRAMERNSSQKENSHLSFVGHLVAFHMTYLLLSYMFMVSVQMILCSSIHT